MTAIRSCCFTPGGAGVDARAFGPNVGPLAARFHVYTPERRAHGHTPDVPGQITFDAMAEDTIAFLETVVGRRAHVVGSSDGAIVGLHVALRRPDLIDRLVLVAGVFHWDGWQPHVIDPSNEPPEFLARLYEGVSPDGAGHYPVVVRKLAEMHTQELTLSPDDLRQIRSRTLIMLGDDDEVRLEHAIAMYRAIPDAELMIVPGTSHGLLVEKPDLCNDVIMTFLTIDPVPTMAPSRRDLRVTAAARLDQHSNRVRELRDRSLTWLPQQSACDAAARDRGCCFSMAFQKRT